MENPYEVVDADQARERAKKKEVKVAPPPAPPQSVYTEEEVCGGDGTSDCGNSLGVTQIF